MRMNTFNRMADASYFHFFSIVVSERYHVEYSVRRIESVNICFVRVWHFFRVPQSPLILVYLAIVICRLVSAIHTVTYGHRYGTHYAGIYDSQQCSRPIPWAQQFYRIAQIVHTTAYNWKIDNHCGLWEGHPVRHFWCENNGSMIIYYYYCY